MTTQQAIDTALNKYPQARRIPVENVAHWRNSPEHRRNNALNLEQDKKAYGWKGDTWKAIQYVTRELNII